MINLTYEDNASLYFDYRLGLELLRNVRDEDYNYPDEIVNFHIYTEVKNNKELECVKSFLATQNLEKTRLVIWSDYEIYDNPLLQPYKHLITFKVYNAREEAVGTPMEHEHTMLDASDSKYYLKSDLFRLMILHKYGGVWADMDIVFLRDFKPILDQEYMYQWGGDTDFAHLGACATVLAMHKQSEFSYKMLDVVKTMPALGDTTVWGKDTFAKLWREWPHFTIFPSTFFNTEWLISKVDRILSEDVENDWFYNKKNTAKDHLFLEAFTWHWHNSSKKTFPIEEGSKFDLLRKRTDALLYKKGIL
tara:strand:+ start:933 stop:1847 length:915 start_codon:yes stop_codon:yes gene_type:complete